VTAHSIPENAIYCVHFHTQFYLIYVTICQTLWKWKPGFESSMQHARTMKKMSLSVRIRSLAGRFPLERRVRVLGRLARDMHEVFGAEHDVFERENEQDFGRRRHARIPEIDL
jgi:hypothetical protein